MQKDGGLFQLYGRAESYRDLSRPGHTHKADIISPVDKTSCRLVSASERGLHIICLGMRRALSRYKKGHSCNLTFTGEILIVGGDGALSSLCCRRRISRHSALGAYHTTSEKGLLGVYFTDTLTTIQPGNLHSHAECKVTNTN
jgi:hypothetical protein